MGVGAQDRGQALRDKIRARWCDSAPDVIEVSMYGYMDGLAIGHMLDEVRTLAASRPARAIIFDATPISGFSPDVRQPGVRLLGFLRESGVPKAFALGANPAVRMMAFAIAFAARLPLEFVKDRHEALSRIAELDL